MTEVRIAPSAEPIDATVRLPGQPDLTAAALVAAALAKGTSHLRGMSLSSATRTMLGVLGDLDIAVGLDKEHLAATVRGCGGHIPAAEADLSCGDDLKTMSLAAAMCSVA